MGWTEVAVVAVALPTMPPTWLEQSGLPKMNLPSLKQRTNVAGLQVATRPPKLLHEVAVEVDLIVP